MPPEPQMPMQNPMMPGPGQGQVPGAGAIYEPEPPKPLDVEELLPEIKPDSDHIMEAEDRLKEEKKEQKTAQYDMSAEEKAKVVAYVKKLVDDCEAGRSDWQANLRECLELYEGTRSSKSDPWPNCSNITTRITATHTKLMHSKLFTAVWNENLIHWKGVEKSDINGAEVIQKFMDWVVRQELRLGDIIDDILHDLIVYGTIALKIRWDTEYKNVYDKNSPKKYKKLAKQKAFIENVPIDDVFIPNTWIDEDNSEYIAQNIYKRLPEIRDLKRRGHFIHTEEEEKKLLSSVEDSLPEGIQQDKESITGLATYQSNIDAKPVRLIEAYIPWEIDGELVESVFCVSYNGDVYLSGKPLTAVSPTGKRPWVVGQFIRKSGIPYGAGLPDLMRGLAHELDAIHNQRIDAGSMSIAPFGFYRAASSFKPENAMIGPGVFIPVDDINDVRISQFPAGGLATSFQEERIIIEYIEKLTSTSAYQMGRESEIAKSRATATGTMALIAQGEQSYNLLGIRTQRVFSRLLSRILDMYQCFMPTGLVDRVLGPDDAPLFPTGLTKEDIMGNYDVYMTLDQTAGNKQMERQISATLIQMAPNLLTISQDPRGYRIAEEFLKSIGKIDVEKYLGPKPKAQPKAQGLMNFPVGPQTGMQDAQPI